MQFVSDVWKETEEKEENARDRVVKFEFPDLSLQPLDDLIDIKRKFLEDAKVDDLKNVLMGLWEDPDRLLAELDRLAKEIAPRFPWEYSGGTLEITVRYLSDHPGPGILKHLSGKTMILLENKPDNE